MKKTILMYKSIFEQVPHLIFMLQLAAHRLQIITFDQVLINSTNQTEPEKQLLKDLSGLIHPINH